MAIVERKGCQDRSPPSASISATSRPSSRVSSVRSRADQSPTSSPRSARAVAELRSSTRSASGVARTRTARRSSGSGSRITRPRASRRWTCAVIVDLSTPCQSASTRIRVAPHSARWPRSQVSVDENASPSSASMRRRTSGRDAQRVIARTARSITAPTAAPSLPGSSLTVRSPSPPYSPTVGILKPYRPIRLDRHTARSERKHPMSTPSTDPRAHAVPATPREVIASYTEYADAQAAVDTLSDREFPVASTQIVGHDVRTVETVTGRVTNSSAAVRGAAGGAWFGLMLGFLFGIFTPGVAWLGVLLVAVGIGALWGALFGFVGHYATRGKRDFASVQTLTAGRYDVLVDSARAAEASRILFDTTGAPRA
ncbi:hypothetical fusion protein [Clavibacter sepedonicus]|uniref:Hypothetical fusion protein n=2 Tax=Microbacteriaceae TaxID=85023 RepID=B0RHQ6_CLASE|nr:hypothetical fusion protein [Clavibacter sepedonicus]